MEQELGEPVPLDRVMDRVVVRFGEEFDMRILDSALRGAFGPILTAEIDRVRFPVGVLTRGVACNPTPTRSTGCSDHRTGHHISADFPYQSALASRFCVKIASKAPLLLHQSGAWLRNHMGEKA